MRKTKDEVLFQINDWLKASLVEERKKSGCTKEDVFDLEDEIHSNAWFRLDDAIGPKLDRLRKKVEVARRLFRFYAVDLSSAIEPIMLSASSVRYLYVLFLKAALVQSDFRYLNSALKIVDNILHRDDCVFSEELRALAFSTLDVMDEELGISDHV